MIIYDVENFPNPLRVRIALTEKNALNQVTFVPVDLMHGEHRTTAFLAKNPNAGVPVLELEDDSCISECSAIIEYIDHQYAGPSLTGITAKERSIISIMQRRVESIVLDAVGTYFHHATDGLGAALETYQNKEWGLKQKDKALHGLTYFNTILHKKDFVTGDTFSVADITLHAEFVFAGFAKIEVPVELTHLKTWQEKMATRPSIH